jgi:YD repeat-containing protein
MENRKPSHINKGPRPWPYSSQQNASGKAGAVHYESNAGLQAGYQYDEAGNRTCTIWPDGCYVA